MDNRHIKAKETECCTLTKHLLHVSNPVDPKLGLLQFDLGKTLTPRPHSQS